MKKLSVSLWVGGMFAFLGAGGACNAIVGIDEPNEMRLGSAGSEGQGGEPTSPSKSCILNSDCNDAADVCLFRVCSPPCKADRDCPANARCLATAEGTACVQSEQADCNDGTACPDGTICDGVTCRIDCSEGDATCLDDQTCSTQGFCRGTDPSRDPLTGPGEEGAPCEEEGAHACVGFASAERLVCNDGKWTDFDSCGSDELCDNASSPAGECAPVNEECEGREPNDVFCDGKTRKRCGPDLVTVTSEDCATIQHCTLASGTACAVCLPGDFDCEGQTLRECKSDLTGFDDVKTCTDAKCSTTAGDCSDYFCNVDQKRCNGDVLEICNAERSDFEELDTCDAGLCDPVSLSCDECVADGATCEGTTGLRICSNDGTSSSLEACETGTCSGPAGSAICSCPTAPSDCSGDGTVCRAGKLATCGLDAHGCLVTTMDQTCSGQQSCSGAFPGAACVCPSVAQCDSASEENGSYCSGVSTLVTCNEDAQSCQSAVTTSCATVAAEQCVGTHPTAKCEKVWGNATLTATTASLGANTLYAIPITVTQQMTLRRIGLLASGAAQGVRMVVYADSGGAPGALRAGAFSGSVANGRNEYAIDYPAPSPLPVLTPGTYWVGAYVQSTTSLQTTGSNGAIRYKTVSGAWAPSPPDPFGTSTSANASVPNFYLVGLP